MWQALISGYNLTNVQVTGENRHVPGNDSIIDGLGWWWACLTPTNIPNPAAAPYCKIFNPTNQTVASVAGVTGRAPLRPKLVEFFNSSDITIANFTAQNGACWHIHPTFSRNVLIERMTVLGPREIGEVDEIDLTLNLTLALTLIGGVDGIDPDSCVNCLVQETYIELSTTNFHSPC